MGLILLLDVKELENIWPNVSKFFLSYCKTDRMELKSAAIEAVSSIVQLFNPAERYFFYKLLCETIIEHSNAHIR